MNIRRIDDNHKRLILGIYHEFPFENERMNPSILEKDLLIRDVIYAVMESESEDVKNF